MKYTFTLKGTPIAQARPRFNTASYKIYNPQQHKKNSAALDLAIQFQKDPIEKAISIEITFFMPIPMSKKKHNLEGTFHIIKPDIDNLIKFVLDACNNIIYSDDCKIHSVKASKVYDDNPRTEFTVEAL